MRKYVYRVEYDGSRWGIHLSGQKLASAKRRSSAIKFAVLLAGRRQRLGQNASFEVKERWHSQNRFAEHQVRMASFNNDITS